MVCRNRAALPSTLRGFTPAHEIREKRLKLAPSETLTKNVPRVCFWREIGFELTSQNPHRPCGLGEALLGLATNFSI